jgi:hypothetical protein
MGGIVIGLVTKTKAMDSGICAIKKIANVAAMTL